MEYTGRARKLDYYSIGPSRRFQCKCGWVGPFSDLWKEHFQELFDASCPNCETMLAIVSFPTLNDIRRAAREGNKEAQKELQSIAQSHTGKTAGPRGKS
jgi:hypothetical protein